MSQIRAIDAPEFRRLAQAAASIYGEAMERSPEVVVQRRDIIATHVTYAGFVAAGAFIAADDGTPQLVGFGYGYRGAPGQWWHDIVADALGRDAARRWLRDGFELAELHVLPDHQGHGLGRELLSNVLSRAASAHAVLSTPDNDSPARNLYRSIGFVDLCEDFQFPGSPEVYAIMGVDL
jgi:ribosomal protein S18 acetylase RimI-like enzyme